MEKIKNIHLLHYLKCCGYFSFTNFGSTEWYISIMDALSHVCCSFVEKQYNLFSLALKSCDTWRYGILKQFHHFGLRGQIPKYVEENIIFPKNMLTLEMVIETKNFTGFKIKLDSIRYEVRNVQAYLTPCTTTRYINK